MRKSAALAREFNAWNERNRAAADTERVNAVELAEFFSPNFVPTEPYGVWVRRNHRLNADGVCETCERRSAR